MNRRLQELAKVHLAITGILGSPLISQSTREQLELFRDELETEIADLRSREDNDSMAAD